MLTSLHWFSDNLLQYTKALKMHDDLNFDSLGIFLVQLITEFQIKVTTNVSFFYLLNLFTARNDILLATGYFTSGVLW